MLPKLETRKDTVQVAIESAFTHVGQIMAIITTAGRDVTRELGDWATDMFEMQEAARRAEADRESTDAEARAQARVQQARVQQARAAPTVPPQAAVPRPEGWRSRLRRGGRP